jgi:hypothetical protein
MIGDDTLEDGVKAKRLILTNEGDQYFLIRKRD